MLTDRIHEISSIRGVDIKTLANQIGVAESTLQRYSNKKSKTESKPSFEVLKAFADFGVSVDWLITGEGEMYRAAKPQRVSYEANGIAVHNNHGSIGIGEQNNDFGGRGNRICEFARWWMATHGADDQAWLEAQIARAVPEYVEWKKGQGK